MDLCIVRSGSVERAGASCQLKKSEVGCCHPTYYSRERSTKVRPFFQTTKIIFRDYFVSLSDEIIHPYNRPYNGPIIQVGTVDHRVVQEVLYCPTH